MANPQITLTALAKTKLEEYLAEEPSETVVRIIVEDDGKYGLSLDEKDDADAAWAHEGLNFVVEQDNAEVIEGLNIDYLEQGASSGFSLTGGKASARKQRVVLRVEETPNPDARKFVLAFAVAVGSGSLATGEEAGEETPGFAPQLVALEGVSSVFWLNDFVTITREDAVAWDGLVVAVREILETVERPAQRQRAAVAAGSGTMEERLEAFIATDVAPFLQQDGGDIELVGVEEGSVHVKLVGACGSCPSSTATLRFGVERRIKEAFPEVQELVLV